MAATPHLFLGPTLLLRPTRRRVAVALSVLAAVLLLATQAAAAAKAPTLAPISPGPHGYFEYTLAPGQSASASVAISDLGAKARYIAYVARASTSPTSGVAYGQPAAHQTGAAGWISPPLLSLSLDGRQRRKLSFRVTVAAGAAAGDYVAAITAQPSAPASAPAVKSGGRAVSFLVTARTLIAVVVHVPGRATAAARFGQPRIGLQQHTLQVLTIPIDDTGRVLMKPYLAGQLRTCSSGRTVVGLDRQLDTFVPRTSIGYPWNLDHQALGAGCYRISLALYQWHGGPRLAAYAGELHVSSATAHIQRPSVPTTVRTTSVPAWVWIALAFGALLLLALSVTVYRLARRRSRPDARTQPSDGAANDSDPGVDADTDDSSHTAEPKTARTHSSDD